MIVGFTGSRYGMSPWQLRVCADSLAALRIPDNSYLLHGKCVGADVQAAQLARDMGYLTEGYPGTGETWRADDWEDNIAHNPMGYLKRNRIIVDRASVMIAAPPSGPRKGGTWYTIRYAWKQGVPTIVMPRREHESPWVAAS